MKVFLDTNVILDFFDSNRGHYLPSAIVFDLALKKKIEISVCAQSYITAFYLLRKHYEKGELYQAMKGLFAICQTTPVDAGIIETALQFEHHDFEDACQYYSSRSIDADVILTRDRKGFDGLPIRHISAEEFLDEFFQDPTN